MLKQVEKGFLDTAVDYQRDAEASEVDLQHDFRLSATAYIRECLESEGENPAIFCCTRSRVWFEESIHRTWNVLTGIQFMTQIRGCIPESTDNRLHDLYQSMSFTWNVPCVFAAQA